jgi:DNA replication and repair protein RecF
LRTYGSQGQQRLALLALLLAEREALAYRRSAPPLMLLDDVMSELDGNRRQALVDVLRAIEGQSVITTTDAEHVPGATDAAVARLVVSDGHVLEGALAR